MHSVRLHVHVVLTCSPKHSPRRDQPTLLPASACPASELRESSRTRSSSSVGVRRARNNPPLAAQMRRQRPSRAVPGVRRRSHQPSAARSTTLPLPTRANRARRCRGGSILYPRKFSAASDVNCTNGIQLIALLCFKSRIPAPYHVVYAIRTAHNMRIHDHRKLAAPFVGQSKTAPVTSSAPGLTGTLNTHVHYPQTSTPPPHMLGARFRSPEDDAVACTNPPLTSSVRESDIIRAAPPLPSTVSHAIPPPYACVHRQERWQDDCSLSLCACTGSPDADSADHIAMTVRPRTKWRTPAPQRTVNPSWTVENAHIRGCDVATTPFEGQCGTAASAASGPRARRAANNGVHYPSPSTLPLREPSICSSCAHKRAVGRAKTRHASFLWSAV